MKKLKLFVLMLTAVSTMFVSCSKDDAKDIIDDITGGIYGLTVGDFNMETQQATASWNATKTVIYDYTVYEIISEDEEKSIINLQKMAEETGKLEITISPLKPNTKYRFELDLLEGAGEDPLATYEFTTPKLAD